MAETDMNFLEASIQQKGERSYYYAHKKREFTTENAIVLEGNGIITGGPPQLLGTQDSGSFSETRFDKITRYSWYEDGGKVKIIIELDFPVTREMIDAGFNSHSLQLIVVPVDQTDV